MTFKDSLDVQKWIRYAQNDYDFAILTRWINSRKLYRRPLKNHRAALNTPPTSYTALIRYATHRNFGRLPVTVQGGAYVANFQKISELTPNDIRRR